ncbi:Sec-independent protein translocase subunit TatA [Mobilicoccus caccae]|uniref:Sec-independent protein translocase protein TatA n=1 Tax=Mobilicoccus caccae TaxID=1859295 RepID=A0ABQ6IPA5_9MICO|nr:Sec-independent protein translocase subunit TatA [Mobilicoccus caccae]GMA39581.1 Sec-independent protein translocase protein TatA [Mobilicoccus caccae]
MPQWLGGPELIIIVLVIVIVFGWKKLPDAARSLGRSMRIFKAEVEEMKDKPSAASRDTVPGEARRDQPPAPHTPEAPRDGERYVSRPATEDGTQERRTPGADDPYRPPMA